MQAQNNVWLRKLSKQEADIAYSPASNARVTASDAALYLIRRDVTASVERPVYRFGSGARLPAGRSREHGSTEAEESTR